MDERVVRFRVGVMVLATSIIAGILVMLFGDAHSVVRGSYTVYLHFTDAPGVTEGTPIRKSGILIGRVTNVKFADWGGVIVEANIDSKVKLYKNEVPEVSGSILGGDVVIQFVRRAKPIETPPPQPSAVSKLNGAEQVLTAQVDPALPPGGVAPIAPPAPEAEVVHDGDLIEGTVAPNPFQILSSLQDELSVAIGSLGTAGSEVGKLANSFNRMLDGNDQQVARIVDKTEQTVDLLQRALGNVDDLLGDEQLRGQLKTAIAELPELLNQTRGAVNTIGTTMQTVDRNLRNMEGLTAPLGERGPQLVDNIDRAVARLDMLLGDMSDFSRKLNRGEGSLGQLMRSPELYQKVLAAVQNIEQLTRDAKPIIADARVFTDKIARHPELLGVRGVIQNNAGTK